MDLVSWCVVVRARSCWAPRSNNMQRACEKMRRGDPLLLRMNLRVVAARGGDALARGRYLF